MIESPEVAGDYYQKIADRMAVCSSFLPVLFVANERIRILASVCVNGLLSCSRRFIL